MRAVSYQMQKQQFEGKNKMTNNPNCGELIGFLLVAFPIIALIFGSDEPAMQTDNAAIIMTGMIFFGIVIGVNSSKRRTQARTATTTTHETQRRAMMAARTMPTPTTYVANPQPQPSSVMTHGSTPIAPRKEVETRYLVICPYCGAKNEQGIMKCQNCSAEL